MAKSKTTKPTITDRTVSVNHPVVTTPAKLPDPLPGLKGMKGGPKQRFIKENQQHIIDIYEKYGDEYTRALYNLRAETMASILKRAEYKGRKNNSLADRAFNRAYLANERLEQLEPEIEAIEEMLLQHGDRDQDLRRKLANIFRLKALVNDMASELLSNPSQNPDDLTYSVIYEPKLNLTVTTEKITHNDIKKLHDVGTTSDIEVYRSLVSSNRKTGKVATSRSRKTRGTLRERYENSKRRYRRV